MRSALLPLLLASVLLGGCAAAPIVVGVGAAAGGVMVANDRRTAGTMIDDERIELNTLDLVARDPLLREHAHINATCFNGQLLLTGEVPSQMSKEELGKRVARLKKVTVVKNALVVGPSSDSRSRTADTATTARVKSRLIAELNDGLANHVKVVTEQGTVFLMGLLSRAEAQRVVTLVSTTRGVQRVVKVFEYQE